MEVPMIMSVLSAAILLATPAFASEEISEVMLSEQKTFARRFTTNFAELATALPANFKILFNELSVQKGKIAGNSYTRYLSFSDEAIEAEIGVPVETDLLPANGMIMSSLPATKALQLLHVGSYSEIGLKHQLISQWMVDHKLKSNGAPWETELTDPTTTSENELKTLVIYPIK